LRPAPNDFVFGEVKIGSKVKELKIYRQWTWERLVEALGTERKLSSLKCESKNLKKIEFKVGQIQHLDLTHSSKLSLSTKNISFLESIKSLNVSHTNEEVLEFLLENLNSHCSRFTADNELLECDLFKLCPCCEESTDLTSDDDDDPEDDDYIPEEQYEENDNCRVTRRSTRRSTRRLLDSLPTEPPPLEDIPRSIRPQRILPLLSPVREVKDFTLDSEDDDEVIEEKKVQTSTVSRGRLPGSRPVLSTPPSSSNPFRILVPETPPSSAILSRTETLFHTIQGMSSEEIDKVIEFTQRIKRIRNYRTSDAPRKKVKFASVTMLSK
jgi:hypothetical protein